MSNSFHRDIIAYLKECYQNDNREEEILDIFGSKIEYCRIIEKKDTLGNGLMDKMALAGEDLLEAAKTAELQEREKKLCLGFLLFTGHLPLEGVEQKICAPLWLGPAEILTGAVTPFIGTQLEEFKINYLLLEKLLSLGTGELSAEDLAAQLPPLPLTTEKVFLVTRLLGQAFPFIDTDPLLKYPEQAAREELKQFLRQKTSPQTPAALFPATALLLIKRSASSRGVLSELEELKSTERLSPPLMALLKKSDSNPFPIGRKKVSIKKWKTNVPAVLSTPQQEVLTNAFKQTLSLVIGPPGTGKSFTIAAVALDHLDRGKSVLIAAKTNQAVDVIADKIETILGIKNFVIRGGSRKYLKELRDFIKNLMHGIIPVRFDTDTGPLDRPHRVNLENQLSELEKILTRRSKDEQSWGDYKIFKPHGFFPGFLRKRRMAKLTAHLTRQEPYWDLLHKYQSSLLRYLTVCRNRLQTRIKERLDMVKQSRLTRFQLRNFQKGIRALQSSRQKSFFDTLDFREIFKIFPVWMVNQTDVCGVLPLIPGLFDIVLIDEATQCDMASTLPILQRASRAVIVGDPHQLRHISFLSRARQQKIAEEAGLEDEETESFNYRDESILDLAQDRIEDQEQVVFLDEHFRSLPPLIRFSNREFYSNALKIMQERPKPHQENCLYYQYVQGGVREPAGFNKIEAKEILDKLESIIAEQATRPPDRCNTIGILSPFSDQVEYLSKKAGTRFRLGVIRRHKLLIGTPYSFQGEERDIMLIGLCLDKDSHPGAFHYFNRSDVFNVAITRARNLQILFGSFDLQDPKVKNLLARYLHFVRYETRDIPQSHDPGGDPFLKEVWDTLKERGWQCWPNFPVAGFHVDLVVEREGSMMGIDLIGYPGNYSGAFELERYRLFNRAGFPIFPLPYHAWCNRRETCLAALENWLTVGDRHA